MRLRTAKPLDAANLVLFADTHFGCQMGLCPTGGVALDAGGRYRPTRFQRKLARWWREFWEEWVPSVTEGEPYAVINDGDTLDGRHHGATTQWSQNIADQYKAALEMVTPVAEGARCGYFHLRGTDAHGGIEGEYEEMLARALGAVPNAEGQYARQELWKTVVRGRNRRIIHVTHHIGVTGSQQYESTAVHKEHVAAYVEAAQWGHKPPDMIVRAHRHRYFRTEPASDKEGNLSFVLPGWQGKTGFIYRTGSRQSQPQFGGAVVRISMAGELYMRRWLRTLTPAKPE